MSLFRISWTRLERIKECTSLWQFITVYRDQNKRGWFTMNVKTNEQSKKGGLKNNHHAIFMVLFIVLTELNTSVIEN